MNKIIPQIDIAHIRNFAVIAHIDHGKTTFCDRLLYRCGAIDARQQEDQLLDSMSLEKERGITIKASGASLFYNLDGEEYKLNLNDSPGHIDFAYEVDRRLAACEGSILIVDATQGVQSQTIANANKAILNDHVIIPVINKIDLPAADVEGTKLQIVDLLGIEEDPILISAKTGSGIDEVIKRIIQKIPAPSGDNEAPLQCLLIDSWYDQYMGVVILVRVKNGKITKGMRIVMLTTGAVYQVNNVGIFTPAKVMVEELASGDVGFIIATIKKVSDCKIGDTITEEKRPGLALPGFQTIKPVVFCSFFPADSDQFQELKDALAKLNLNDSSFTFDEEIIGILGHGFRCGFLGLLHLDIIQERLIREFGVDLVLTAPNVVYQAYCKDGSVLTISTPHDMPDPTKIEYMMEPWVSAVIIFPDKYLGSVMELCNKKRAAQIDLQYSGDKIIATYELPLAEIVFDFYDQLKSLSSGYASIDWEMKEYRQGDMVKLRIMINSEDIEALSFIVHKQNSESFGRSICSRLKELIPRQQYKVPIQAAIGGKIIARETIEAYRKDVTAKLYGGDVTRKMKLLEKQRKGKKRMRLAGSIDIPNQVFIEVLKIKGE